MIRSFLVCLLLVSINVLGAGQANAHAADNDTFFSVSGDVTVTVDEATANMVRIRDRIPAMTIVSAPASIKKLGSSYSINLFSPMTLNGNPEHTRLPSVTGNSQIRLVDHL